MEYEYYNRGKCNSCNEIIWVDKHIAQVACSCNMSTICGYSFRPSCDGCPYITDCTHENRGTSNVSEITYEEFKEAIRQSLDLPNTTNITLIDLK